MPSHTEKSFALADRITTKAEQAVAALDREMSLGKWPAEFRAIMWDAVVIVAQSRAADARATQGAGR